MGLKAKYASVKDRGAEWVGVIFDDNTIVTVGTEYSEAAIKEWCELTLVSWSLYGVEAPDAFDRMQAN